MVNIAEAEAYLRRWLSYLDKDVYGDSIAQLEPVIQQWKKTGKTLTSLGLWGTFDNIKRFTFRDEFLKRYDYPHSAGFFDAIDNMISRLTQTDKSLEYNSLFVRVFGNTAMLRNIATTHEMLMSLKRAREKLGEHENGFYIICFSLLLAMEGIYDEIVRFVYVTEQVMKGKPVDSDRIEHTGIDDIRAQIETPQKEILGVWDEAHRVRNAVAHARFRYDQNDKKMRFVDIRPNNPKDVFRKTLTIEETQEIVNKIAVIEAAYHDLVTLLQIYSVLIAPLDKQYVQPPTT